MDCNPSFWPPAPLRVFMAGAVINSGLDDLDDPVVRWRSVVFRHDPDGRLEAGQVAGQFIYGGPDIDGLRYSAGGWEVVTDERRRREELVSRCIRQVEACDVVFAWIDREHTVGSVVEITVAALTGKPLYISFQTEALAQHFYFMAALTSVTPLGSFVVEPTPEAAWEAFTAWAEHMAGAARTGGT
jgi:hypothetical protein